LPSDKGERPASLLRQAGHPAAIGTPIAVATGEGFSPWSLTNGMAGEAFQWRKLLEGDGVKMGN